mgnify:CR=1 FL=1
MKFYVLPYTLARCFVPEEPTLAIRIFDPGDTRHDDNNDRQKLVQSPFWVAELQYAFVDFDPLRYSGSPPEIAEDLEQEYQNRNWLLTPQEATRIIQEFSKYKEQVSAVMIHCNAGMSRSPTVALFLCKHFGITPIWIGTRDYYMKNCTAAMAEGRPAPNSLVWGLLEKNG